MATQQTRTVRLEEGRQYRVLRDGCKLSSWKYVGRGGFAGKEIRLKQGDTITFKGYRKGIGSDNINQPWFEHDNGKGHFVPNVWGHVAEGFIELIE